METRTKDSPLKPALWNGWRRKCPRCGKGPLLFKYLKIHDTCSECGLELHHHRADDGPAYLTIFIVAHLLGPVMHIWFVYYRPEPWVMGLGLIVGSLALSLYLLPRFKGFIVSYQWAKRMGGFKEHG